MEGGTQGYENAPVMMSMINVHLFPARW